MRRKANTISSQSISVYKETKTREYSMSDENKALDFEDRTEFIR